jgi:hypothetical protein
MGHFLRDLTVTQAGGAVKEDNQKPTLAASAYPELADSAAVFDPNQMPRGLISGLFAPCGCGASINKGAVGHRVGVGGGAAAGIGV